MNRILQFTAMFILIGAMAIEAKWGHPGLVLLMTYMTEGIIVVMYFFTERY